MMGFWCWKSISYLFQAPKNKDTKIPRLLLAPNHSNIEKRVSFSHSLASGLIFLLNMIRITHFEVITSLNNTVACSLGPFIKAPIPSGRIHSQFWSLPKGPTSTCCSIRDSLSTYEFWRDSNIQQILTTSKVIYRFKGVPNQNFYDFFFFQKWKSWSSDSYRISTSPEYPKLYCKRIKLQDSSPDFKTS